MKIAVLGGKRGLGKTFLSVNLAMIAEKLKKQKVVLVDLDVERPNCGVYINKKSLFETDVMRIIPKWKEEICTLCNKCLELCKFNAINRHDDKIFVNPELCRSSFKCLDFCPEQAFVKQDRKNGKLIHYTNNKIDFIEGNLYKNEPTDILLIQKIKEYINDKYQDDEIIVFDCPPGNSYIVIESLKNCDLAVIITEQTPSELYNLKLEIHNARYMQIPIGVVINKYSEDENETEKYCEEENIPILGKIPYDIKLSESENPQKVMDIKNMDIYIELFKALENIIHYDYFYKETDIEEKNDEDFY